MKKVFLVILLGFIFSQAYGFEFKAIKCESPRLDKSLVLKSNSVTFINKNDDQNRAIASMAPARTQRVGKGFNQVLRHDGKKYHIHVSDTSNFNDTNDFIEIKTLEGHNIIYPITCTLR